MPKDRTLRSRLAHVPDWAILLLFCLLFSLQVILAAVRQSATFDEPANLASGYVELTVGDYWLLPRNLPFVKWVAALPLLFVDVRIPPLPQTWNDFSRYSFAHAFLYELNDADTLLLLGRLAVLPLALLLGGLVYWWTRQLFGRGAGLLALVLYTFEPNILAHSGLVTTDLAVACLMFGTVYGLYHVAREGVSLAGLLLPGLALGLALLTKYSLHPLVLILLLLAWVLLAYGVLWAAYRFRYDAFVLQGVVPPRAWDHILPAQPLLRQAVLWARAVHLLPEAYLYGFSEQLSVSGHYPAFLMGEIRDGGWWYFFLVTFLLKTPLALLLLVGGALARQRLAWREAPVRTAFLGLPVLVYFLLISASGWNIGHRHLLPIYPFLCVLVGGLVPWAIQRPPWGKAALAAWYCAASLWIAPHYLAYFNELIGGPAQGYRYLVGSNLDWGQDLKGLKRYMDAHGISRVWLSYFGTARPDYYGIVYNYLPSVLRIRTTTDNVPTPFVAISATNLQGVHLRAALRVDPDLFKKYQDRRPIARIGYSIFLYRLE
jgi:hypothetical protein